MLPKSSPSRSCRRVSHSCGWMVHARNLYEANSSLTTLSIWHNKIGNDGAKAMADALKATLVLCIR